MTHPEEKSDANLLTYWQQSVDAALAQPVSNPRQTSLHISAGEMARLVAMAEQGLKYRPAIVDDEWDAIIRAAYADNDEEDGDQ